MTNIEFSNQEKEVIIELIKKYFDKEFSQEIGQFDAEFLLDFFSKEVGSYFYNRGLYDAQAILESRLDTISEAIHDLELPTKFMK